MSPAPVRAVLVDALGTLVRLDPPAPALVRELSERVGAEVSEADAERGFAVEIGYYLEHQLEGRDERSLAELRGRCAAVLARELGIDDVDPAAVAEAMLAALSFTPYPDAAPALRELRAGGLGVVAASNWDCSLPGVLRAAGLWDLLDGAATSATAGATKPDPAVFREALAIAGVAPGEALHVGDSPENDLAGARGAGVGAVLLVRDGRPPQGALATLADLPSLVFGPA